MLEVRINDETLFAKCIESKEKAERHLTRIQEKHNSDTFTIKPFGVRNIKQGIDDSVLWEKDDKCFSIWKKVKD